MRLTVKREQLLKALQTVSKAVPQKKELPILANIKIELNNHGLDVTASDGNITIRSTVPFRIGEEQVIRNYQPGATLIDAKLINETIKGMEGEEVNMELIDNSLRVYDSRSTFDLNITSADEYPDIDLEPVGNMFTLRGDELKSLVHQTAFAASTKEARPVLTAINLNAQDNVLTALATDTARLARKKLNIEANVKFSVNIPAKKLVDICSSFEDTDEVDISISDKKAQFAFNFTIISTRLINGEYPNTRNVFNTAFNYHLQVNSGEIVRALKRLAIVSADREGVIKLIMSSEGVEVLARSTTAGNGHEKLSMCNFDGERFEISFKSAFVIDAISALRSEDVTICFISPMNPFVIKNENDDSVDMLVTPLRS